MTQYLPIRIKKSELEKTHSTYVDKFLSYVDKSLYPVEFSKSCQLLSKGGRLVDESILDLRSNVFKIKLDSLSKLTILYLLAGKSKPSAYRLAKETLSLFEGKDLNAIVACGLSGSLSDKDDRLSILLTALYYKTLSNEGKTMKIASKFTRDSKKILYSANSELRFNVASIYLKLVKNLNLFCDVVLTQGDYILVDVSDTGVNTLMKVLQNLFEFITFDCVKKV